MTVTPAAVVNAEGGVADLTVGSLCPDGVLLGTFCSSPQEVLWNDGTSGRPAGGFAPQGLRRCEFYTGTGLEGRTVQLKGKPPEFRGVCVQQLDLELGTVNNTGPLTPVVVVKTPSFSYIALPADVEEVE
jgi:hypothetical protein